MPDSAKWNVVLIEDDEAFAEELVDFLDAHGVHAHHFASPKGLELHIERLEPDLVILDQFVGGKDLLSVMSDLRKHFHGGMIVLTGNQDAVDRVVALECGADDFVSKSLGSRELLARIRAVLRRAIPQPVHARAPQPVVEAPQGAWVVDQRRQEVRAPNGAALPLTAMQFDALVFMARNAGRLMTRDELSEAVLHRPFTPLDRSLDNLLSNIRKRIEVHVEGEPVIRSVRGRGYVFTAFALSRDGGNDLPPNLPRDFPLAQERGRMA